MHVRVATLIRRQISHPLDFVGCNRWHYRRSQGVVLP